MAATTAARAVQDCALVLETVRDLHAELLLLFVEHEYSEVVYPEIAFEGFRNMRVQILKVDDRVDLLADFINQGQIFYEMFERLVRAFYYRSLLFEAALEPQLLLHHDEVLIGLYLVRRKIGKAGEHLVEGIGKIAKLIV